jgi:hypothetical protein
MTFSATRSITGVSEARRPRGPHGFARMVLVLAWVAFWFNTGLFPCCEAVAAAFGDHSGDVSQSASAAPPAHHLDEKHSECPHHSPDSPCGHTLDAVPAIAEVYAGLPTDRVHPEWFAIDVFVVAGLTAVNRSTNLAPREHHRPPPPFRLYLHTQRLLI